MAFLCASPFYLSLDKTFNMFSSGTKLFRSELKAQKNTETKSGQLQSRIKINNHL
jgi:hypothetical protein